MSDPFYMFGCIVHYYTSLLGIEPELLHMLYLQEIIEDEMLVLLLWYGVMYNNHER